MDNIVIVEVIHGFNDLANSLRGVFLGESSALTDSVEQLSSSSQLSDNIVFVLAFVSPQQS